ncbi:unnamed protein product [Owenia fusiformis]|uniref:Uncharacterized protein n=1 Tax=Owenia fusiformis TaxID=6347 RepID=A0A8J1UP82_OWEFU|nr:unnamed protein product [Owenia fusiformis]
MRYLMVICQLISVLSSRKITLPQNELQNALQGCEETDNTIRWDFKILNKCFMVIATYLNQEEAVAYCRALHQETTVASLKLKEQIGRQLEKMARGKGPHMYWLREKRIESKQAEIDHMSSDKPLSNEKCLMISNSKRHQSNYDQFQVYSANCMVKAPFICEATTQKGVDVMCDDPKHIEHGSWNISSHMPGATLEYHCMEGYILTGGNESYTCMEGGYWSGELPWCEEVRCGPPPYIPSSRWLGEDDLWGSVLVFQCVHYDGSPLNDTWTVQCGYDGWQGDINESRCTDKNADSYFLPWGIFDIYRSANMDENNINAEVADPPGHKPTRFYPFDADDRASAKGIGITATVLMLTFLLCIFLLDLSTLLKDFKLLLRNLRSFFNIIEDGTVSRRYRNRISELKLKDSVAMVVLCETGTKSGVVHKAHKRVNRLKSKHGKRLRKKHIRTKLSINDTRRNDDSWM